jgi:hypothetical protein
VVPLTAKAIEASTLHGTYSSQPKLSHHLTGHIATTDRVRGGSLFGVGSGAVFDVG